MLQFGANLFFLPCLYSHSPIECCDFSARHFSFPFSETLNWKKVVLVLGRRLPQAKNLAGECDVCADEESVLMVWNGMLPMELKDLQRHCNKREQLAVRMREQFQAERLVCECSVLFKD